MRDQQEYDKQQGGYGEARRGGYVGAVVTTFVLGAFFIMWYMRSSSDKISLRTQSELQEKIQREETFNPDRLMNSYQMIKDQNNDGIEEIKAHFLSGRSQLYHSFDPEEEKNEGRERK
ncbi:hypothetical protein CMO96_01630 [Candidatus Woesebacteria bacterium]|nr:hypothetical protein [Candidatus Woesebacteria bacterium]